MSGESLNRDALQREPAESDSDATLSRSTQHASPILDGVFFGSADAPLPDWRAALDDADPDDEELDETPPDVIAALGFDPREAGSTLHDTQPT